MQSLDVFEFWWVFLLSGAPNTSFLCDMPFTLKEMGLFLQNETAILARVY